MLYLADLELLMYNITMFPKYQSCLNNQIIFHLGLLKCSSWPHVHDDFYSSLYQSGVSLDKTPLIYINVTPHDGQAANVNKHWGLCQAIPFVQL